jgi:hypothetical protein
VLVREKRDLVGMKIGACIVDGLVKLGDGERIASGWVANRRFRMHVYIPSMSSLSTSER